MKFLILGLVALTTVAPIAALLDIYEFNPVPVDDAIVEEALAAKKSQIILDVIQKYPDITYNPFININSADKKTSMLKTNPTIVYYRLNLTLAVLKPDPVNSKSPGIYTPIVTFNVTITSLDYPGHPVFTALQYDGLDSPKVQPTVPPPESDDKPVEDYSHIGYYPIAPNDTGLWLALTALQDPIWQKLKEHKIKRPNATSAPRDDFWVLKNYAYYHFTRNSTTGNLQSEYQARLTVLNTFKNTAPLDRPSGIFPVIKPKPVQIWVELKVEHKPSYESFFLSDRFHIIPDHVISYKLADLGPQTVPDLKSPAPDHDCNHFLGNPEPIDVNSKHLWTVFNAVKKEALVLVQKVYWRLNIPDNSLFVFNDGTVQYKNNHGDLDAPIVRKFVANFTVRELPSGSVGHLLPLRDFVKTKVTFQESIDVVKGSSVYNLLQVDNCQVNGPCRVPY